MSESSNHAANAELAELCGAFCNGTLGSEDAAKLQRILLDDPQARAYFRRYVALDVSLGEHGESAAAHWAPEQIKAQGGRSSSFSARWLWRSRFRLMALAAMLILAVTSLVLIVWRRGGPEQGAIAKLQQVTGDVRLFAADGQAKAISTDTPINTGDSIRTHGSQSSTVVAYPDGTRLTLVGDTSVTCGDQPSKLIVVHHGTLAASVQPQPRQKPMVVSTPLARMQVLGTRFLIEALASRTDVRVSEGLIKLTRIKDGKAVDVPGGSYASLTERNELLVKNSPDLAPSWDVDFETGLPEGWVSGEYVTQNLPRGSRGGVKAVQYASSDGTSTYGIRCNEAWVQGLFAIEKKSHLHFTFKMETTDWLNAFVITRTKDPRDLRFAGNYLFRDFPMITPGRWQSITIPLASFKRIHVGNESIDELVPYNLIITGAGPHCGLVIDRIWITPDGPGEIKLQDVE